MIKKIKKSAFIGLLLLISACGKKEPPIPLHSIHPCPGIDSIIVDGTTTYHTVQIGTQCWLRENLNRGTMDTSYLTFVYHSDIITGGQGIKKYCYDNNDNWCFTLGGLYDWNEMMQYNLTSTKGICPDGFRLPDTSDISKLVNQFGGYSLAGKQLLVGGSKVSGFDVLLAGERSYEGGFQYINEGSNFWLTDIACDSSAFCFYISPGSFGDTVFISQEYKVTGHSVRCIKE